MADIHVNMAPSHSTAGVRMSVEKSLQKQVLKKLLTRESVIAASPLESTSLIHRLAFPQESRHARAVTRLWAVSHLAL